MIYFDPKKLIELKAAHDQAVTSGESEFTFQGDSWHIDFAKYLIEYLEDRFKQ